MKEVTAAIIIDNGRILLARRAQGQKLQGKWEFPGGKLEQGETYEQCLKREISEELGVSAFVSTFFAESVYEYDFGKIKLLAYYCALDSFNFDLSVHSETNWVDTSEIMNYDLAPADIPIAQKLAGCGKL